MAEKSLLPVSNYTIDFKIGVDATVDIMPDENLDLKGSGMVDLGYRAPFTLVGPLTLTQSVPNFLTFPESYYDNYGNREGLIQLKLVTPTLTSTLVLKSDCNEPSVMLISTDGTTMGLYCSAYGDVHRDSVTSTTGQYDGASKTFWITTWTLPDDFLLDSIVIGAGGGGYPQEVPTIISEVRISNKPEVFSFWGSFEGQYII